MTYWVDPVDLRYLKVWHRKAPVALIAEAMGMSELAAWRILDDEGLGPGAGGMLRQRPWTRAEDEFLILNYPKMGTAWCARRLGRTRRSIKWRVRRMALRVPPETKSRIRIQRKVREYAAERRRSVAFGKGGDPQLPQENNDGGRT